jgi:hypothetical protein
MVVGVVGSRLSRLEGRVTVGVKWVITQRRGSRWEWCCGIELVSLTFMRLLTALVLRVPIVVHKRKRGRVSFVGS